MKTKKQLIDEFIQQNNIAVVGASAKKSKFGNTAVKGLLKSGYQVTPINPREKEIEGCTCYASINAMPQKPQAVLVVVKPQVSVQIAKDAIENGVEHIWFQQGAESDEALNLCAENGVQVVSNECIMMFTNSKTFPHNLHKFINKIIGRYPS